MIAEKVAERLGISTMVFPPDRFLGKRELNAIRARGIRRIEIAADYYPEHFDYTDNSQVKLVRNECEAAGIQIISFHTPFHIPYGANVEEERRKAVEMARKVIDVMLSMGGSIFVVHLDINADATTRTIHDLLDLYRDTPLKLAVENGAVLSHFSEFVDQFDTDRVGTVVDIGHAMDSDGINPLSKPEIAYNTITSSLPASRARLLHMHLHDWDKQDHIIPFEGKLIWNEIFRALFDSAYMGTFMFEISHQGGVETGLDKVGCFPELLEEKWFGSST